MRTLVLIGFALAAMNFTRAEEPNQAEVDSRLLAEKLGELEKLQAQIDLLRQKTGQSPQQILVSVRAIEIQTEKLRMAVLSHPLALQATPVRETEVGFRMIDQESLDKALHGVKGLVKKGFAKILVDASVLTVSGRHERMLSGSEFPVPMPLPDGGWENQLRFAGLDLELLSRVNADQQIDLDCNFKWSERDPARAVKSRDSVIPGLQTHNLCTRVQMKSRETVVMRGLVRQSTAGETELVWLITAEQVDTSGESPVRRREVP